MRFDRTDGKKAKYMVNVYEGNTEDHYYFHYISIFNEWVNDFDAFDKYISSLQHHNEPGYTIDRINNNGNYEPGNLRWATASEQAKNRGK